MALSFWLVPVLFRRELVWKGLARWQPYIYGLGMSGVSLFLMGAGTLGVPRRHWDILFSGAPDGGYEFSAAALTMMSLNGMSVLLACIGGAVFVLLVVGSLLFGRKLDEDEKVGREMIAQPPSDSDYAAISGGAGAIRIPGTLVMVFVFLGVFALYYFINWKYLGETWGIS
jgi:cytochrome c oxidase subunit 1